MPKDKFQKHTVLLWPGDFERLRDLHPAATPTEVLRELLRNHIKRVVEAAPTPAVELST